MKNSFVKLKVYKLFTKIFKIALILIKNVKYLFKDHNKETNLKK